MKAMLLMMILVIFSASLFAQQTGAITGTVVDKTGAVIPGAKITLINTATKDIRRTVSNGEGFFSFNAVVTGSYAVKAEFTGFKTIEQSGITLSPGDRRNLNIELPVGKESEQITVEAAGAAVQVLDSGERSANLTSKDIKNLALQGRDVTELVKTLPGFNNTTGGGGLGNKSGYDPNVTTIGSSMGNGYSANGVPSRSGGADLISDGAHVIDPGCNCAATMTINADMVQEVKVTTSNFSAESSKGPVTVQAVGKSGSSEFHGAAYLHFRDTSMNSTDWNVGSNKLKKPKDRYWYPGGSFGGPVRIPGTDFNKSNKLIFWSGYEYYNQIFPDSVNNGVSKAMVPTDSMRDGKFDPNLPDNKTFCAMGGWLPHCSGITGIDLPSADGKTSTHYNITNSDISAYIDPGAKAILKMIPHANVAPGGGYNFVQSVMSSDIGYMWKTRVDYNFSDATKLYVSYNQQRDDSGIPVMLWWAPPTEVPFPGGFVAGGNSKTWSGNFVRVINPTTTNEFIGTLSYLKNTDTYTNRAAVSRSALGYPYKGIFGATDIMPSLSNGWWLPGYPMLYQQDADGYFSQKVMPTFSDNLTKVVGTHTLKVGANWEKAQNKQLNFNQQNGQLTFGTWGATSIPVANLLLGVPTGYTESNANTTTDMAYTTFGFYFQDHWKTNKRLTLDLGLRITHDGPWTDNGGGTGMAVFTPDYYKNDRAAGITSMPGMYWHGKAPGLPLAGRDVKPLFYAPRFGLAYDLFANGKTVLRGGFGAYYYHDQYNDYAGAISTAMGGRNCGITGVTSLAGIDAGTNVNCGSITGATAVNPKDDKQPVTYTYSFTLSQSMPGHSLLEVAYSGNQSKDLINPLQNKNAIPLGTFFGVNQVTGKIENIIDVEKEANGVHKDDYRQYRGYSKLDVIEHGAWANYNALQISWNKPRGAFTYGLNYTWSKTMGIYGEWPGGYDAQPDPINIQNNYGVMNTNRTHVLNATYSYEVGNVFKGNKLIGGVINGWMISGITGIQSGAPLQQSGSINFNLGGTSTYKAVDPNTGNTVTYNFDNFYADNTVILGSSDYKLMPTISCNPNNGHGGFNVPMINSACFGVPGASNGVYQSPVVYGPSYFNSDLALQKTFKITERQNVQFRLSAFNFLNHPLVSFDPSNTGNLNATYRPSVLPTGTPDATGNIHGDYSTYKGPYTLAPTSSGVVFGAPQTKFGRRVVELSLKYAF